MFRSGLLLSFLSLALVVLAAPQSVAQENSLTSALKELEPKQLIEESLSQGDSKRGAILFHQPLLQCSKCHSVSGAASKLGPSLAVWEEPATPQHLLESLLTPSRQIRKGYETITVLDPDDRVVTGILVNEDPDSITIREASGDGRATRYEKESIEVTRSAKSIMPEGLIDQLSSKEQFFDLLKYVLEVSEKGPAFAAEIQPPAALTALPPLPEYERHIAHAEMLQSLDDESLKRGRRIYSRVCANCHGTHESEGSLPTSPRFAEAKLKNGHAPYRMYQTLTHGHGLMVAQRWMVPQQKYDVIHYIREAYFKEKNSDLYVDLDQEYLDRLPKGDTLGPEPTRYEPYVAMDYGPSLINTYEIELNNEGDRIGRDLGRNPKSQNPWANPDEYFERGEAPNYAYKGIAIRLDEGPGGISRGRHWAVYDHDTMSLNAAWSGNSFIDYCCIQFDGQHNTHNRLTGTLHFENPVGPGWGQPLTGVFHDPRPLGRDGRPYGPLPSAWYKYQGLYHFGLKTILSYRVGNAQVLEHATVVEQEEPVFVRHLTVGPAQHRLILRLGPEALHAKASGSENASVVSEDGYKVLSIAARDSEIHLSVFLSNDEIEDGLLEDAPLDLHLWTQGGQARWPERVKTKIQTVFNQEFMVDELQLPTNNPWNAQIRATGHDFFSDQERMALCTWDGDVWLIEGASQDQGELTWQRIATGLFQPLGLKIVDDQIYVTCRDQLVLLRDLNGDNETDFYECFNSDHQVTEHFHEFAMGLQRDSNGNFYYAKSGRHAKRAVVPHHGTLLKVSPDGKKTDIIATGFRAANGVCLNPDGSFFVTDQEGHWNPKNRINWVTEGGFYGNMYGFSEVSDASDDAMSQPLCWITNRFDRSPAELLWVPEDAWGVFAGSLLNLSYGYGKVFVVPHEEVNGQLQGGMCQLPIPDTPSGLVRGRFHPKRKDLYACGMFSWAGSQQAPGCFYRIRYSGKPVHLPLGLRARSQSVEVVFSHNLALDSATDVGNYKVMAWDLKRTPNYGSKHFNEREWPITSASLGADGKTVTLSVPELEPTWGMSIEYDLKGANGRQFNGEIHNSVHNVRH